MTRKFKKFGIGLLVLTLAINMNTMMTANAAVNKSHLTTEDGFEIGMGTPKITTNSKGKTGATNVYPLNSKDINGSLSQTIPITSSPSGVTIEIPLEFDNKEKLVLYQDEFGRAYNTGNILNKDNKSIGIVNAQMTKKNGKVIITSKMKGNNLIIEAKSINGLEPVVIQVDMTASNFSTYFSKSEWIYRGGITSLSLSQKQNLSNPDKGLNNVKKVDAWSKIESIHKEDSKWSNEDGLKDQFMCHYDFASKKELWNLEPARPDVDYLRTVLASCNP